MAYEDTLTSIYPPFIANHRKAVSLTSYEFYKIQNTGNLVACKFMTLDGFLLKLIQQIVKYHLVLKVSHLL